MRGAVKRGSEASNAVVRGNKRINLKLVWIHDIQRLNYVMLTCTNHTFDMQTKLCRDERRIDQRNGATTTKTKAAQERAVHISYASAHAHAHTHTHAHAVCQRTREEKKASCIRLSSPLRTWRKQTNTALIPDRRTSNMVARTIAKR